MPYYLYFTEFLSLAPKKKTKKGSSRPAGLPTITNVFLFSFFISVSTKVKGLFGKGVKSKGPRLSSLSSHSSSQKRCSANIVRLMASLTIDYFSPLPTVKLSSFYAKWHHLYEFIRKTLTRTSKSSTKNTYWFMIWSASVEEPSLNSQSIFEVTFCISHMRIWVNKKLKE